MLIQGILAVHRVLSQVRFDNTCHEAPLACSESEICGLSRMGLRFMCQLAGQGADGDPCENLSNQGSTRLNVAYVM